MVAIGERGELRVCVWPEYFATSAAASWKASSSISRALAARLGVRAAFVETNLATFMDRLEGGDCDIALAVGITPARSTRSPRGRIPASSVGRTSTRPAPSSQGRRAP